MNKPESKPELKCPCCANTIPKTLIMSYFGKLSGAKKTKEQMKEMANKRWDKYRKDKNNSTTENKKKPTSK